MTRAAAAAGRVSRLLRAFRRDERGNVAIIFGLAVLPLMAAAGLATDTMLAYTVEDQLQTSLDAAGLAAGRALEEDDVEPDALAFLRTNFDAGPGLATLDDGDVDVVVSEDGGRITLTATAVMPTRIMRLFGQETVTVSARTVIHREVRQMELALVLDNTGSMVGAPFNTMRAAAHDLVNIVYGDEDEHPNLYVAVVPYASVVNVGSQRTGWLTATDPVVAGANPFAPSTWKGCVRARADGYDQTDDPPSVRAFRSYLYPDEADNDWGSPRNPAVDERLSAGNNGYGPNLGCGPPITALSARKSDVRAALDAMGAWHRGGTSGNQGLVWGWRVLSPRWRGLWGGNTPNALPLAYGATRTDKIVVMLTDGNNNVYDHNGNGPRGSDFTAYGRLWDFMGNGATAAQGVADWDARMTRICTRMKANGISIYTVTFGGTPNASTQTLYRNCASRPDFYFHAPNNATLRTVFRAVGMKLSNLRVAE